MELQYVTKMLHTYYKYSVATLFLFLKKYIDKTIDERLNSSYQHSVSVNCKVVYALWIIGVCHIKGIFS